MNTELELDVSYEYCARIARRARSNFYYTFALLPVEKRRAMHAVYAYLRELDDIADGAMSLEWQAAALEDKTRNNQVAERLIIARELPDSPLWQDTNHRSLKLDLAQQHRLLRLENARQQFVAALAGEAHGPILPALIETIKQYNIPPEYFLAVMQGVAADIVGREYQTWDELRTYCYRVASVVGLICLHIWGFRDERAFAPATACGLAFQLTNILRDLGEDAAGGRIYLPREEITSAGYTVGELEQGRVNAGYERLIEQQLARARELYAAAEELPRHLQRDGQRIYAAMFATYRALLDKVSEQRDQLLQQRVRIGRWHKVWIAARALWQTRLGAPPTIGDPRMSGDTPLPRPRVAIIGGGLAGLAAATELSARANVTIYEARSKPGGRAGAFVDAESGATLDLCQHVALGCCTRFLALLDTWGIRDEFQHDRVLHFLGPGNELCRFEGSRWLPAPLHLLGAFANLRYLTWRERFQIGRNLLQLWWTSSAAANRGTIGAWLDVHGMPQRAQELFWKPVIESALSESLDQASFSAARNVFVKGFLTQRSGYELWIPRRPMTEILQDRVLPWLAERGVHIRLGTIAAQLESKSGGKFTVTVNRELYEFDQIIAAVPWNKLESLLDDQLRSALPQLAALQTMPAAPIVSVHLWYDRQLTELPHVVLPGRVSQWLFATPQPAATPEYGYQIVISAAYELLRQSREEILRIVTEELHAAFPNSAAQLVRSRVIIEPRAVFAPRPETEALRLPQRTAVPGLLLAGDWTATDWPATMEGAIRSGELAAAAVGQALA